MENSTNGKSSITINQLLVALLGILVPIIGYLGNSAIGDTKSQIAIIQIRQREDEEKTAHNAGQLEQFAERITSLRATIDERWALKGGIESTLIMQGERIARLEAQQDRLNKK